MKSTRLLDARKGLVTLEQSANLVAGTLGLEVAILTLVLISSPITMVATSGIIIRTIQVFGLV